jgi:hypothetical protein
LSAINERLKRTAIAILNKLPGIPLGIIGSTITLLSVDAFVSTLMNDPQDPHQEFFVALQILLLAGSLALSNILLPSMISSTLGLPDRMSEHVKTRKEKRSVENWDMGIMIGSIGFCAYQALSALTADMTTARSVRFISSISTGVCHLLFSNIAWRNLIGYSYPKLRKKHLRIELIKEGIQGAIKKGLLNRIVLKRHNSETERVALNLLIFNILDQSLIGELNRCFPKLAALVSRLKSLTAQDREILQKKLANNGENKDLAYNLENVNYLFKKICAKSPSICKKYKKEFQKALEDPSSAPRSFHERFLEFMANFIN